MHALSHPTNPPFKRTGFKAGFVPPYASTRSIQSRRQKRRERAARINGARRRAAMNGAGEVLIYDILRRYWSMERKNERKKEAKRPRIEPAPTAPSRGGSCTI